MRIAFLFNYPLIDNRPWKQALINGLAREHELLVLFGKSRIQDYVRGYLRRRSQIDVGERVRNTGEASPVKRTVKVLRSLGVAYETFASVNDATCRDKLLEFGADFVVTALDHRLSSKVLDSAPVFLNAHYGILPDVKGWNATEWSLLTHGNLSVSLHRVAPGIDTGEIYMTRPVTVAPGDTLEQLRGKCQDVALGMYRDFLASPEQYLASPARNEGGRTYYTMNRRLKGLVEELVRSGRVS
ncbi:MAG: formyltransferase family protein [Pseudomonadota bacterium]|nr:formyltransferase family protein [Pseudomonadota bacterium]